MKASFTGPLPTAGGLSGVKRMQMALRDSSATADLGGGGMARQRPSTSNPSSTNNNTGIMPPKPSTKPASVAPAGYEQPHRVTFNQRLSALSSPNFPRRRGQG